MQDELIAKRMLEIIDILDACCKRKYMEIPASILKKNFLYRDNVEDTATSMNKWILNVNKLLDEEAQYYVSLGIVPPYVSRLTII